MNLSEYFFNFFYMNLLHAGSFPIKIYLFTDVSNVHMNMNSKSAGNPSYSYFFLIFPTINNNNGRIKHIVKDNGVQAVAIKF